jgi:hypothetical protein
VKKLRLSQRKIATIFLGEVMLNIKRILCNYKQLMIEKLKIVPKEQVGEIEFLNDEIKRVEQALQLGVTINNNL